MNGVNDPRPPTLYPRPSELGPRVERKGTEGTRREHERTERRRVENGERSGAGKVRIIYSVRYIYYPYTTPLIIYIIV